MQTIKYTIFLSNYLRDTLSTFSDEELRLTIFLFEVLINKDEEEFSVLLDEFINGWNEEQGEQITQIISATGLNELEVLSGLEEVKDRGLFTFKAINTQSKAGLKSFIFKSHISLAIKHSKEFNFYLSSNEDTQNKKA